MNDKVIEAEAVPETQALMVKPEQPREANGELHYGKCPCNECETWAWALLDWEEAERKAGRDPHKVRLA